MDKVLRTIKRCMPVVLLVLAVQAQAQVPTVFTVDSFLQRVKLYHPLARQANIQVDKAEAGLLAARGNFDPVVGMEASRKTFDSKNYYRYYNPELTVPLPVGNLKTGVEDNGGDLLNPEVTKGRTSYLGIEVPLLNGLLLDKRRAALRQAKLFRTQSEQQRLIMLNDLYFQAYTAYWQWAASYQQYHAYSRFTDVAAKRLRLVRIAYAKGDRALVDTVEAFTQLQNYQLLQADALLKWNTASLELSNYLWTPNETGYLLPEQYIPDSLSLTSSMISKTAEEWIAQSSAQNPALKIYDYKLSGLELERKLKWQSLLPYVSLKANLLNQDYYALKNISSNFIQNNYRWGINISVPLLLREARGNYQSTLLKIKETQFELAFKRQQTETKIRSAILPN